MTSSQNFRATGEDVVYGRADSEDPDDCKCGITREPTPAAERITGGGDGGGPPTVAKGCIAFAGCWVFLSLALMSLGAVPPLFYGIRYNNFVKYANIREPYQSGRYFVGPWNSFVLFPATVKSIEFLHTNPRNPDILAFPALHTRTKEGLALHIEVALQYRLIPDKVGLLYNEFNMDYEQVYTSTIRDALIQALADFDAPALWTTRSYVGETMRKLVNQTLWKMYAECWGLQLMTIQLPDNYDAAIVLTQVQNQNYSTMQFAQQAIQIKAETDVIESEYHKNVTIILASGTANYTVITNVSKAHAKAKILDVESQILTNVKEHLALAGDDLVSYQELNAVKAMANATLLFGFENSTSVMFQSQPASTPQSPRRLTEVPVEAPDPQVLEPGLLSAAVPQRTEL